MPRLKLNLDSVTLRLIRSPAELRLIEPLRMTGFSNVKEHAADFPFDNWDKHAFTIVAFYGGKLVATGRLIPCNCPLGCKAEVFCQIKFDRKTTNETNGLTVLPEYRNYGIGTLIEVYKLVLASYMGTKIVFGITDSTHPLLESLGYAIDKCSAFNYGFYGEKDASFFAIFDIEKKLSLAKHNLNNRYGPRLSSLLTEYASQEVERGLAFLPFGKL